MAFLLPKVIPGAKASFFSQYSIDEKCYGFTFGTHCFGVIKSPVIKWFPAGVAKVVTARLWKSWDIGSTPIPGTYIN